MERFIQWQKDWQRMVNMTNEERIYKLCEYVMDLIDEISYQDELMENRLEWVKDEIKSIREDIDNS